MDFTLESPYLFESLAAWRPAMAAPDGAALRAIYADGDFRRKVKEELEAARGQRLFNSEWDKVHVVEAALPEHRHLEGATIEALAAAAGRHPLDVILDLALAEDLATAFIAQLLHNDEEAVGRILQDGETHIALSDAGAHLTFLCDAGYGLHLLGYWARDKGVLSLGEAVRRLTGQPAGLFGIQGRGLLREGLAADIMLFDPARVGRGPKRRVFDLPAGAARLTTDAVGLHGVWVNGRHLVDDAGGILEEAGCPGTVLRRFAP
jgi:N-acyl-D-aspartate/D-glutamate deacylase